MAVLLTALLLAGAVAPAPNADAESLPSLAPPGIEGELLVVVGRVLDIDGKPVAGAEVFAYHADAAGKYHDDAYRGTVRTDAQGYYRFRTVRPGGYGPAPHIHFQVKAGSRPELRPTLFLDRSPTPPRKIRVGGQEATEYTFDIVWGRA